MTFQLMTDTATDLSFEYYKKHQVDFIGFTVTLDGKEYHTGVEGEVTPEWLLEQIDNGGEPTTSQVNVGQFLEVFTEYAKAGTEVLYLAFSSGLSGTYSSAVQALELVKEDYPEVKIHLVDTLAAANGEGLLVDEAVQMRDNGATLEEVAEKIEKDKHRLRSWVTVNDLHHLQRGGRISKAAAIVGSLASIKPLIDVDGEGKLRQVGMVRGRMKALKRVADETIKGIEEPETQTIFINYSGDRDSAVKVQELISAEITVKGFAINPLGPTIVSHTGSGTIAVFSLGETDR
ncbi:MAG: DegV family protein [Lactobacillales bacterium]|jgi:DegV family protein with EDD domain|nr:DegV family protein [Lactobacillales bacterium]